MKDAKRLVIVCAIAIATCLFAGTATASAAPTAIQAYAYSHSFGTEGQQVEGEEEPQFLEPPAPVYSWEPEASRSNAIGIDPETHDVIVCEQGEHPRLAVYDSNAGPADPPVTTFGGGTVWEAFAVAPNGDVYARTDSAVVRFLRDPGAPPSYTLDPSYAPETGSIFGTGMAIDPSTGDLLIAGVAGGVDRYDHAGNLVFRFLVQEHGGSFDPKIAATSDGTIFVYDTSGNFVNTIDRFTPSGTLLERRVLSEGVAYAHVRNMAYDPAHDAVDIVRPPAEAEGPVRVEGVDSTGKQLFLLAFPDFTASRTIHGIAPDPYSGRLYSLTTAGTPETTGVLVFEPWIYPGVEQPLVSGVAPTSARVSAGVDPGSGPPAGSYARFEYSADGGSTWTPTPDDDTPGPTVEAELTGLQPNFTYLVRAVAGNENARHLSEPTTFSTTAVAPIVVTGAATDVTETGAVLNGTINPAGLQATYHFEYGTTAAYGNRVPVAIDAVAGNGRAPRIFSRTLTRLAPGTTYHFRLAAANSIGPRFGEDHTFTTAPTGGIPARAYEQVTPVDKNGGTIVAPGGFQISTVGTGLSYMILSAGESHGSPLVSMSFSRRGGTDWEGGFPIDPPLNVVRTTVYSTTLGISADFSHAFVVSNKALAPGAVENATNLYVKDLTNDTYRLVATTDTFEAMATFVALQQQNKFIYGTPDYGTVLFVSLVPLLEGVHGMALYRWTPGGGLRLDSRLPDGSIPTAEVRGPSAAGYQRTWSADARRDYFTLVNGPEAGVYLNEDGRTRAISVSHRSGDDPTLVQPGEVLGVSRDGRYAFIVSYSAQLTEDAPELPNDIYRYDAETGELEYIGGQANNLGTFNALGVSDNGDTLYWVGNGLEVWRRGHVHQVADLGMILIGEAVPTPDGRYLAYQVSSPSVQTPIYLYDAETETSVCASCRSDGTDPGGASLPIVSHEASNEIPVPFDDQGDLFFTTTARLVAADGNGMKDVYEFSRGKLRLISPGNRPFDANLADVSPDGRDVYIATAQPLVSRDTDQAFDIYDARVGGGLPAQNPPEPQVCIRDDCKATPNGAAEPRVGGSELLSGPGNVKPKKARRCPKGKRPVKSKRPVKGKHKHRARCVKKPHRKHPRAHKAHPKQADKNRRQGR